MVVVLAVLLSAIAAYALRVVVASKDHVIEVNAQNLIDTERLRASAERKTSALRAFLLTREDRFIAPMKSARADFTATITDLRARARTEEDRRLVDQLERAEAEHQSASDRAIALRRADGTLDAVNQMFEADVEPRRVALDQAFAAFSALERRLLEQGQKAATETASSASSALGVVALAALFSAAAVALVLTRALTKQISAAIQHVQSSSSELVASASQQATGAKEQATAMSEISTTISELLATSKQIAESAQRVAHIAAETAASARSGEQMVQKTDESMASIKRQVDVVVTHMLDLGRKSQQIGGILEIVNELADQTNILAINATIEAVGAGEAGKRFGVVADEIRKLADRVTASTKEIRGLIDEIRAAVNATVMATESGTKAVDLGARQFADVAAAFDQITSLVGTTTEAAREIELSTKQQSTAVEQVNVAIVDVAQATKESEASASQTSQTASQLTGLSRDLMRLIRPEAVV